MNGSGNDTPDFGGGEDATLRDPALRRALDHAPDSDAVPDPRTRDAIRKMAHNLAPVPATAAENKGAASWWRRLFGGGGTHARMPWNAAFATVLLAVFVTVLWHREPVPDARLDGEAGVASAPATVPEPAPSAASAPASAPAPAPAQPSVEAARDAVSEEAVRSREDAVRRSAPLPSGQQAGPAPQPQIGGKAPEPPLPLPSPLPAPAPAPAPAPPPPAMAPAVPPVSREAADGASASSPALSAQRSLDGEASGALRSAAPAPRAAVAAKAAAGAADDTSAFSALDRWTSLNLMRAGQSVRHARGDTEGLAALVNTLARSATAPGVELAAPVEARLELYRGTTLLAVLEIAGDQVRWTPQGAAAGASVGTPPAPALAELRALLARH